MADCYVYVTHNNINGKKYLGKHNGKNSNYLGSGKLLKRAIAKYGKEHFRLEIIQDNLTENEAYLLENKLSIEWNVTHDKSWYNLKDGGLGFSSGEHHPMFRIPKSEEHRKKLSEANKGFKVSDQTKKKISIAVSGTKNPMYGKRGINHPAFGTIRTEEHRKCISRAMTNRKVSNETKTRFSISRRGKGCGDRNSMALKENRIKVSLSKIGRKKFVNEDGTYSMRYPSDHLVS